MQLTLTKTNYPRSEKLIDYGEKKSVVPDTYSNPWMPKNLIDGDAMTLIQLQHTMNQIFGVIRHLSPLMTFHLTSLHYRQTTNIHQITTFIH